MYINVICFRSFLTEMARDPTVGRDRVLIMPGGLAGLDNMASGLQCATQPPFGADINQQILEVSEVSKTFQYTFNNHIYFIYLEVSQLSAHKKCNKILIH